MKCCLREKKKLIILPVGAYILEGSARTTTLQYVTNGNTIYGISIATVSVYNIKIFYKLVI